MRRLIVAIASLASTVNIAAAAPPLKRGVSLMEVTLQGNEAPFHILAIVPLQQGLDVTLEMCNALASSFPSNADGKVSCRNLTVDEAAQLTLASGQPRTTVMEHGVVAVLHITEASGRVNNIDAFEILNVSGGILPPGRAMAFCEHMAKQLGNRTLENGMHDVHYTCEVDDNP